MTVQGIDISHYQKGLDLAKSGAGFVMLKATEGTTYVDPECDHFYQAAKAAGILRGVYHFYRGGGATEADFFVSNIRGYVGDAVLALDFEDAAHIGDQAGALAFLNRVRDLTGVKPILYASGSVVTGHDWSGVVAGDYGLWLARWGSAPGSTGQWKTLAMWQKTSDGSVPGYSGRVDLDEFYGDAATWAAYAAPAGTPTPAPAPAPTPSGKNPQDGQDTLVIDGNLGGRTIARWQQVLAVATTGTITADLIAADQRFLNSVVPSANIQDLTGQPSLRVDGANGTLTVKVRQFWLYNRQVAHLPALVGRAAPIAGDFDGNFATVSTKLLQYALNDATAGSGRY